MCTLLTKIPKVGIPKAGIPTVGSPKAGMIPSDSPRDRDSKARGCNPARPLQESPGPSGPGRLESVSKESPGPSGPGSKKCPKQSRNSLRSLKTVYFQTPETVSRLFRTLLDPGAGRPRETLLRRFRVSQARRAWETPVRGGRDSKGRGSEARDSESRDSEARNPENGQIHASLNSGTP